MKNEINKCNNALKLIGLLFFISILITFYKSQKITVIEKNTNMRYELNSKRDIIENGNMYILKTKDGANVYIPKDNLEIVK